MKSKLNFILNWNDVVYAERNNIVFENRNKSYGAFAIRMLYERNLILSLLFSVFLFGGVLGLQALLKHTVEIIPKTVPPTETPYVLPDAPPIIPDVKPEIHRTPPPSSTSGNFIVTRRDTKDTADILPPVNPSKGDSKDTSGTTSSVPEHGTGIVTPPIVENKEPVKWAAEMPTFPGGDAEMMKFLGKQMIYPKIPLENGIQGTVFVTFVVNQDGSLSDIKVLSNGNKYLNDEAVRVVKKMPKWSPGKQNGNPVRVQLNLPVKFKINEYR